MSTGSSTGPAPGNAQVLSLADIVKHFGRTRALSGASLTLDRGTVHALLGENGAGKSTLMRVAYGVVHPDSGTIHVDGVRQRFRSAADARAAGIGMVHQHSTSIGSLTVAENVALGGRGRYDARQAKRIVADIGERTGLRLPPDTPAEMLSATARQRLEIVKALANGAHVLVLDEPTAMLADQEVADLFGVLRQITGNGGAVVLITHKLREAMSIASRITVLRRGLTVLVTTPGATTQEALAEAMLGEPPPTPARAALPRAGQLVGPPAVRASHLSIDDEKGVRRIRDASFEIRPGELLGIVAVEGAGQRELLRALAGLLPPAGGELHLPARVGYIPEDRHRDALILGFSLAENVALRGSGQRRGHMPWSTFFQETASYIQRFDIRAEGPAAPASALSGGNQQKLVLARELDGNPDLIVAENPGRGLDIAAMASIHERLQAATAAGTAVVLHSTDLDEVLALASRILVVYNGQVISVAPDRTLVGRAMLGVE